jgi:ATP phosphoribosyltransferase regulatory subunit
LRQSKDLLQVELDLGGREKEEIREYARRRRIANIAWVNESGSPTVETL